MGLPDSDLVAYYPFQYPPKWLGNIPIGELSGGLLGKNFTLNGYPWVIPGEFPGNGESLENHQGIHRELPGNGE